jgi:hypothetical protein
MKTQTEEVENQKFKICPKCKEPGLEVHLRSKIQTKKKGPVIYHYVQYIHKQGDTWKKPKRCYLGSIKALEGTGFFNELEKKNIEEAYILNKNLGKMIQALHELFDKYSPKSSVPIGIISEKVMTIVDKYGH